MTVECWITTTPLPGPRSCTRSWPGAGPGCARRPCCRAAIRNQERRLDKAVGTSKSSFKPRINLGSTRGQPGVGINLGLPCDQPGASWVQPRVKLGSTQGQAGFNPGSRWD
jgi:hypothetical protein